MSNLRWPREDEVLMTDLCVGDRFTFEDHTYTLAEPPQSVWGVVEVWVEELEWPFTGSDISGVLPAPRRH